MAVYTLTTRIIDESGCVRDVKQAPFLVLDEDECLEEAEKELLELAEQLEELAEEIALARHDKHHRHHHWWMP